MCVAVGCVAPAGFEGWRWERGMERGAREGGSKIAWVGCVTLSELRLE